MRLLFAAALFVGAALLFLVQPLLARMVLPLLGGAPAVWNTCMVFFQALLLLSYAYAHAAPTWLGARRHAVLHLGVMLLPLLVLPLRIPLGWPPPDDFHPILWLTGLLCVAVGLPFVVAATTSPLLQRWFAQTGSSAARDPYFLYGASNLGSILGLLAYPFVLEPTLTLANQGLLWAAGYGLLVALTAACAAALWLSPRPGLLPSPLGGEGSKSSPLAPVLGGEGSGVRGQSPRGLTPHPRPLAPEYRGEGGTPPVTAVRRVRWVLLAFVPSSLMLSVTTYLTTDVAPVPLLWVGPLTLYLLTFVLAFARKPVLSRAALTRWMPLVVLPVVLLLLSEGTEPPPVLLIALHLFALFWIGLVCHSEMAHDRPPSERLTEFYLWLAVGGVGGGLFNALLAPLLFPSLLEYPLVLVLACLLRPPPLDAAPMPRFRHLDWALPAGLGVVTAALVLAVQAFGVEPGPLSVALMFAAPLVVCYTFLYWPLRFGLGVGALLLAGGLFLRVHGGTEYRERSFFAVHTVTRDPTGRFRLLVHGNTVHGRQDLDPARAREPLAYYHRTGPAGQLFAALDYDDPKKSDPRLGRVGVVGLGTGALCCYAAKGEKWTFYEIDPAVKRIACDSGLFTYYRDCPAERDVVLGDARLSLARSDEHFGVLVIDAFSSDAVPVHLLTREALAVYLSRLDDDGLLVFHVSNRFLDLRRILADQAENASPPLACLDWEDLEVSDYLKAAGKQPSEWVVLARTPAALKKVREHGLWQETHGRAGAAVWTDDFSNVFGVLKWGWAGS